MTAGPGSKFNREFVALANHRKAIHAETASYAERFRTMQLAAISSRWRAWRSSSRLSARSE